MKLFSWFKAKPTPERPDVPPNLIRQTSTNLIANKKAVQDNATLVAPVRLYGTVTVDAKSSIGKYTYIGTGTYVTNAMIGSYCSIARHIEIGARQHPMDMLSSHSFQYGKSHFKGQPGYTNQTVTSSIRHTIAPAIVGHDVWIGAKAIIRGGVTIGPGAVIGAGSIVTKDVPPYAVVVGAPAKVIKYRFPDDIIEKLLKSEWWTLEPIDMDGIDFRVIEQAVDEIAARKAQLSALVNAALKGELVNQSSHSNEGTIWFDVEKSYAVPSEIAKFSLIDCLDGKGPQPIERAWFDAAHNRFGIRTKAVSGRIEKSTLRFRLL